MLWELLVIAVCLFKACHVRYRKQLESNLTKPIKSLKISKNTLCGIFDQVPFFRVSSILLKHQGKRKGFENKIDLKLVWIQSGKLENILFLSKKMIKLALPINHQYNTILWTIQDLFPNLSLNELRKCYSYFWLLSILL